MQSITKQARDDVSKFKTELVKLKLPIDLNVIREKCRTYLDNWDKMFDYRAKFDLSEDLDDQGSAAQSFIAIKVGMTEIFEMLGLKSIKSSEPSVDP